jgi:hypothetical protein
MLHRQIPHLESAMVAVSCAGQRVLHARARISSDHLSANIPGALIGKIRIIIGIAEEMDRHS